MTHSPEFTQTLQILRVIEYLPRPLPRDTDAAAGGQQLALLAVFEGNSYLVSKPLPDPGYTEEDFVAVHHYDIELTRTLSTKDIGDAIRDAGFFNCAFTGAANDHRHWIIIVLLHLEQMQWVRKGTAVLHHEFLTYKTDSDGNVDEGSNMAHGVFKDPLVQRYTEQLWDLLTSQVRRFCGRAAGPVHDRFERQLQRLEDSSQHVEGVERAGEVENFSDMEFSLLVSRLTV